MNRFLIAVVVVGAAGVGCSSRGGAVAVPPPSQTGVTVVSGSGSAAPPVTSHTPAKRAGEREIWLVRNGRLWPTTRRLAVPTEPDGPQRLFLLVRPNAAERRFGISTAVPLGTQLLGMSSAAGDVLTVNLNSRFAAAGTPMSERLRLAQLVYTATSLPHIHGVRLQLDGKPVTVFSSDGLVLPARPLTRSMYRRWLPFLAISSPAPGGVVSPGTTITGLGAGISGSDIRFRLLDAHGDTIMSGDTSSGCPGACDISSFSFPIEQLETPRWGRGTLVVSRPPPVTNLDTLSAVVVRLPVILQPTFDVLAPAEHASLTSPATVRVSFVLPNGGPVHVGLYDARFHLVAKQVIRGCPANGKCLTSIVVTHLAFQVAGVQPGYLVFTPLPGSGGGQRDILEMPVTLNGG